MLYTCNFYKSFTFTCYPSGDYKEFKMKTVWKWILGIVIVVLLVGAFAAAGYFWSAQRGFALAGGMPFHQGWNGGPMMQAGPMMHGGGFGWQAGPMMRGGRGFGGFFLLGAIGWLLRLAFFGLLLYGAYWLGRRSTHSAEPRTAAPAAPPSDKIPPAS